MHFKVGDCSDCSKWDFVERLQDVSIFSTAATNKYHLGISMAIFFPIALLIQLFWIVWIKTIQNNRWIVNPSMFLWKELLGEEVYDPVNISISTSSLVILPSWSGHLCL